MPVGIVTQITEESLHALTSELKHLRGQVKELHERDSQLITENRALVKDCLACVLLAKIPAVKPAGQKDLPVTILMPAKGGPQPEHLMLEHTCP